MKHKILFTGGSGLLSVCWSRYICSEYDVYLALHERSVKIPNTTCLKLDLSSYDSILAAFYEIKPSYVVNSAALTNVEYCEKNFDEAFEVNTELSVNIGKACESLGIKLIHISTDHIFDGLSSFYTELSKPNPINVYGSTKLEAEIGLQEISQNHLIIRTNFFDKGPSYRQSFSDWIIDKLRNNEVIYLFNDVFYTPTHIFYLVKCVHQLIHSEREGIFNVVGPKRLSKFDFGIHMATSMGLDVNLIHSISIDDRSDLISRPRDMSLDNAKVRNLFPDSTNFIDHLSLLSGNISLSLSNPDI